MSLYLELLKPSIELKPSRQQQLSAHCFFSHRNNSIVGRYYKMLDVCLSASFSLCEATSCVATVLLKMLRHRKNSCVQNPAAFQKDLVGARRRLRPTGAPFVCKRDSSGDPIKASQEGKLVEELERHYPIKEL